MFSRHFAGVCLGFCLAFAATAASAGKDPVIYGCELNAKGRLAFAKNPLMIIVDPGSNIVLALDSLIHAFTDGAGVRAEVVRDTPKDLVLRWTLKNVRDNSAARSNLRYEAKIAREDGSLRLTIVPESYPRSYSYRGTCKILEAKPGKRKK